MLEVIRDFIAPNAPLGHHPFAVLIHGWKRSRYFISCLINLYDGSCSRVPKRAACSTKGIESDYKLTFLSRYTVSLLSITSREFDHNDIELATIVASFDILSTPNVSTIVEGQ